MFHHIPDLPTGEKGYDGLVRSTEFDYADLDYDQPVAIEDELAHQGSTRFASFIRCSHAVGLRAGRRPGRESMRNGTAYPAYLKKSLPPLEFEYSKATIQRARARRRRASRTCPSVSTARPTSGPTSTAKASRAS